MDPSDVLRVWRQACSEQLDVIVETPDRWRVIVPALTANGLPFEVDIVRDGEGWFLNDNGQTTSELAIAGFNWTTDSRRAGLDDIARAYGAKLEGREITAGISPAFDLEELFAFVQALSSIGASVYAEAPPMRRGAQFKTIVGDTLEHVVIEGVTVAPKFRSLEDVKGLYKADFGLVVGTYIDYDTLSQRKDQMAPYRPRAIVLTAASSEIAERAAGISRWWAGREVDPHQLIDDTDARTLPRIGVVPAEDARDSDAVERLADSVTHFVALDPEDHQAEALTTKLRGLELAA